MKGSVGSLVGYRSVMLGWGGKAFKSSLKMKLKKKRQAAANLWLWPKLDSHEAACFSF